MVRALLFGVTPLDIGAYTVATVILLVVACGAAILRAACHRGDE